MLNRLVGVIKQAHDQLVVLDVGSLWFEVQVPCATHWTSGQRAELHAYMHWNQENGPALFGFATEFEKQIFLLTISCSGVGPKLGLAVLAELGAQRFVAAVQQEDDRALSKVTGIGARKAEQLLVQLRHKVAKLADMGTVESATVANDWHLVSQTLESLRYSRLEIARAIAHLRSAHAQIPVPFDQLVKSALSYLTKQP